MDEVTKFSIFKVLKEFFREFTKLHIEASLLQNIEHNHSDITSNQNYLLTEALQLINTNFKTLLNRFREMIENFQFQEESVALAKNSALKKVLAGFDKDKKSIVFNLANDTIEIEGFREKIEKLLNKWRNRKKLLESENRKVEELVKASREKEKELELQIRQMLN
jgi:UDP-N-acetylmuramate-alanine ligase